MKYSFLLSLLLFGGITCAFGDVSTIFVSPNSQTVYTGQTFSVDIDVNSIPDLFSYQFTLNFDPSVLAADSITEGELFASTGDSFFLPGLIDNSTGNTGVTADSLFFFGNNTDHPGTLAVVDFTAIGTGTTSLEFTNVEIYDSSVLFDPSPTPLSVTTASGTIDVVPVAEPATLYLLATALGLMLCGVWKRSRNPLKGGAETIHL